MSDRNLTRDFTLPGRRAATKDAAGAMARRALLPGLMAAALGFLPAALNAQAPSSPRAPNSSDQWIVKGRILVRPNAGLSTAELDKILAVHGGRRARHLPQINVHVIELPAAASEIGVVKALRANPHIKFAEPDVRMDPMVYLNDPMFGSQWHLPKIAAPSAWDFRTGSGVTIAILDSGVEATHPDLIAQLVPGWNSFDNNSDTSDLLGHGTRVSGTAAAGGNNSVGVAGVSFASRIMPIKITDASGNAWASSIAGGLTWAADHGARVANISYSGITGSSTVLSAAQYMRSKGGVVTSASGNSGALSSIAPTDYVTVVGATDQAGNVASFSDYGSFLDVVAPGVSIYTTTTGGGYSAPSGTSHSSPVVAGVYALMISANPALPPSQLDGILFSTATDIGAAGRDDKSGWGVVNASAAVTKAMNTAATDSTAPTAAITSPTVSTRLSGLASVSVSATDNVAVARTELYVNGALYATDTAAPFAYSLDTTKLPDGSATLLAKAFDAAGNAGTSAPVTVTIGNDTVPPVVTIQSPTNGSTVSGTVTVSASATDNQKVAQISLSIDGKQVSLSYGSSLSYSWSTGSTSKGGKKSTTTVLSHTLVVTAKDTAGNVATQSMTVTSH